MIKTLIKKIILYVLIIISFLGNTGWIFSSKVKNTEKDVSPKNLDLIIKDKPVEKIIGDNPEILSWKGSTPPFSYRNYNSQKNSNGIPQHGQVAFLTNINSTASVSIAVANFDYIVDSNYAIINEMRDINIDIVEPKSFLAINLNEEWKENINFYSGHSKKV